MDRPQHTLQLATELLEDVELSRASAGVLVLKALRLARLTDDDEMREWLQMESHGYYDTDLGRKYMTLTGRWIDQKLRTGYWQSVSQIEATLEAQQTLLSSLRLPDLSGDYILPTIRDAREHQASTARTIGVLAGIRSKVIALVHQFATTRFYELAFSARQAELFEQARVQVDSLLAPVSGETLSKVESIYRRLSEGDAEAISQALNTCRRLIDSVSNAVYPPSGTVVEVDGNQVKLGAQHVQNRLNAYVRERTSSDSRRRKLRRSLGDLYDRVSSGVHQDVSSDEARFLFLNTYLYLGEVLALQDPLE